MLPELIFEPVINMLWLSLAVFAFGTTLRLKSIIIDKKAKKKTSKFPHLIMVAKLSKIVRGI